MERRKFLQYGTLAGTSLLLSNPLSAMNIFIGSPNEKVICGVMGLNSRGTFLMQKLLSLPNVEIAYLCDVDANVLSRATAEAEKISGIKPKGYSDIRKMLEKKDFDVLVIAAPDHWHAPAAIMACQTGKHVYVEKPCSHNPKEGEMIVEASKKYNKLVQMGSQRRSFDNVQQMVKEIREGVIGRTYFAKCWYDNNRPSIGKGKMVTPPTHLNYDLWQGFAPRKPYQDNVIHYNWHWFWNWGTGEALNNGTHEIDVVRWAFNADYPSKVTSSGGRFQYRNDDWQTPDTQTILINFPNDTAMSWEGRSCNGFKTEGEGRGATFYGDGGTIFYGGGNSYKVYDEKNKLVKSVEDSTPVDATNKVSPTEKLDTVHLLNFINTIRGLDKLNAPILEGHRSTILPQLGNISYRVGRTLNCDPKNGHILHDEEASKLWTREYQPGWNLKV